MQRIVFIIFLFASGISSSVLTQAQQSNTPVVEIPVKNDPEHKDENSNNKGSRMPVYVPVKAYLLGNSLTVTCDFDGIGEVNVFDYYSGTTVASEEGELSGGVFFVLDEYHRGYMEISISINGKHYIGKF